VYYDDILDVINTGKLVRNLRSMLRDGRPVVRTEILTGFPDGADRQRMEKFMTTMHTPVDNDIHGPTAHQHRRTTR